MMKILIVDDEKFLVENLARYLRKRMSAEIQYVSCPHTALDLIQKEKFDLIICDLKISDQIAGELLLKITEIIPEQKFIVISAQEIPENLILKKKQNIAAYFEKPFNITGIEEKIKTLYKKELSHTEN